MEKMRRGTFRDETVDYAAVGASQAPDLMQYPPRGSTPAQERWRLGSGEERFKSAAELLLTWTAQKASGLKLSNLKAASGQAYTGVSFDAEGNPIAPVLARAEQRFDAQGMPGPAPGMTLQISGSISGFSANARVRVISVTEETRRAGFILGTVADSVVSGEESFDIDWDTNTDEVWLTVRAFDTPKTALYRWFPALIKRRRKALFNHYLRAISPLYANPL